MKKSEILWTIIGAILLVIGDYHAYQFATKGAHEEKLYCGTVVYRSSDEITIKYGTKTELYLGVEFEDGVGRHAIETDVDTYISKKVGDHVCFSLTKAQVGIEENVLPQVLLTTFAFISALVTLALTIAFLVKSAIRFNRWIDKE